MCTLSVFPGKIGVKSLFIVIMLQLENVETVETVEQSQFSLLGFRF